MVKTTLEKLVRSKIFSPLLVAGTLIISTPLYAGKPVSVSTPVLADYSNSQRLKMVSTAIEPILNFDLPHLKIHQKYNLENRLLASTSERPPYLPPEYGKDGDSSGGKSSPSPSSYNPNVAPSYAPVSTNSSGSSSSASVSNSKVNWGWVFGGLGFAGASYLLVKGMEGCTSSSYKGGPTATNCDNPFETIGYVGVALGLVASVYGLIGK